MRSFKYLDITVRGAQSELEGSFPTWRTQLDLKKEEVWSSQLHLLDFISGTYDTCFWTNNLIIITIRAGTSY